MISNDLIDVIMRDVDEKCEEFKKEIKETLVRNNNEGGGVAYNIHQFNVGNKTEGANYTIAMNFIGDWYNSEDDN